MKSLLSLLCCQEQMSDLHSRLLWFLANLGLLHLQHVLLHHRYNMHAAWASVMLELPQKGIMHRSANSLRLAQPEQGVLAVGGRYFSSGLCKVSCRASACPEAHLPLPQPPLLHSGWVSPAFLLCLQEGNPIFHTCDHVSTSWSTYSVQEVNCLKVLPKKIK